MKFGEWLEWNHLHVLQNHKNSYLKITALEPISQSRCIFHTTLSNLVSQKPCCAILNLHIFKWNLQMVSVRILSVSWKIYENNPLSQSLITSVFSWRPMHSVQASQQRSQSYLLALCGVCRESGQSMHNVMKELLWRFHLATLSGSDCMNVQNWLEPVLLFHRTYCNPSCMICVLQKLLFIVCFIFFFVMLLLTHVYILSTINPAIN